MIARVSLMLAAKFVALWLLCGAIYAVVFEAMTLRRFDSSEGKELSSQDRWLLYGLNILLWPYGIWLYARGRVQRLVRVMRSLL